MIFEERNLTPFVSFGNNNTSLDVKIGEVVFVYVKQYGSYDRRTLRGIESKTINRDTFEITATTPGVFQITLDDDYNGNIKKSNELTLTVT